MTAPSAADEGLTRFNALPTTDAEQVLFSACASRAWAQQLAASRPFTTTDTLFSTADRLWLSQPREEWLAAFSHHPRIGERNLAQPKFAATAAQSSREQSGMAAATDAQRQEFAAGNQQYEQRFGHIFLICAAGKSAADMLSSLNARLGNDPETELRNAAGEQLKITRLRLERWLTQ